MEFLVYFSRMFGIFRTIKLNFLNSVFIFAINLRFLAWNFPKIDEIFLIFCRVYEEYLSCEPPAVALAAR